MGPPIYIGGNPTEYTGRVIRESASMGPPIYIGGNKAVCWFLMWMKRGFNGATDLHRWKPPIDPVSVNDAAPASMGPPIYIGGNKK